MKQELEMKEQEFESFEVQGQAQGAVGAIITLVVGVAVATLILIFVGALGGQTYNLVEPDINSINNTTIQNSVKNSMASGFTALEQTGDYMPIIVLAVIISVVLALVLGFTAFGGGNAGRGSAL
jgi:CHASE3 domain sensor protein